jgi:2-oxoglutarate ferredoxin oxidoreductase subunit alpha
MFDLTVQAFNLSEQYRVPVLLMADEAVGHMSEKVVIPELSSRELVSRPRPKVAPEKYIPYDSKKGLVPPMAVAGEGYRFHITGLTHDDRGYPAMNAEAQDKLIRRLVDKIRLNTKDITKYEEIKVDDAEVIVVSYGISARIARYAVQKAREEGIKAGLLRLITVWPFADDRIKDLSSKVKAFIVPEINYGQMVREVERCVAGKAKVRLLPHMGGGVHRPEEVLEAIREEAR